MKKLQNLVNHRLLDDTHTVVRFATSWATRPEDIIKQGDILSQIRN